MPRRLPALPATVTMMLVAALPLLFSPGSHHRIKLRPAGASTRPAAATVDPSDRLMTRRASQTQAVTIQSSTPTAVPTHDTFPGEVRLGSTGPAVTAFQSKLAARGWQLAVDGVDGPVTTKTLQAFQTRGHLEVDGIGGPQTWGALLAPGVDPPEGPAAAAPAVAARPAAPVVTAAAPAAPPVASVVRTALGGVWACIRQHESGGNYATNTGNGYYGAYQFSLPTWRALGGLGLPSNAPPAVQDAMAQKLQAMAGWNQWPQTSKMCGV